MIPATASDTGSIVAAIIGTGGVVLLAVIGSAFRNGIRLGRIEQQLIHQDECLDEVKRTQAKNSTAEVTRDVARIDRFGTQHSQEQLGILRDRVVRLEVLTGHEQARAKD